MVAKIKKYVLMIIAAIMIQSLSFTIGTFNPNFKVLKEIEQILNHYYTKSKELVENKPL